MMKRIYCPSSVATATTTCLVRFYHALPSLTKKKGEPAALPPLPFDATNGCPPTFSTRQIELHHGRHHKAYVDKLNTIIKEGHPQDGKLIEEIMSATVNNAADRVLFNQAAQHFNHTFYWECLVPKGKTMPDKLSSALKSEFGSVEDFKKKFEESGLSQFGSGWTWLVYNPESKKLQIVNTGNAGCPTTDGLRPLLTADVWEHAYYPDFENKRADYLHALWAVVNWEFVAKQYERATSGK
jgi:Fe-Mn family superoxide dismutase